MTISIIKLSIMAFSKTAQILSIMTLSMEGLLATLYINDT
jgi:hypothetical protein